MYRVSLKTAVVEALKSVVSPNPDFQGANAPLISIEYPVEQAHYPGIWVQYADDAEVSIAGIGHVEQSVNESAHTVERHSRWSFSGAVTMTLVALSSFERDRLYDEVVRIFVGARFNNAVTSFRTLIEANDLVAINANFDDIESFGDSTGMGTPWGTEEPVYEISLRFDVRGEFVTDSLTAAIVPLSRVTYTKYIEDFAVPAWAGDSGSSTQPSTPGDWDRTQWT